MRSPLLLLLACAACSGQRITKASSTVYVRSDTDRTTIVTPKVAVAGDVADGTSIEASYEIDAWTGASIDVITAATAAISEIRNEANAGVAHQHGDLRVSAGYRFSTEPDYDSHGLVLGARLDLANKNTTLGLDVLGSTDRVGRAGDPFFDQSLRGAGARASLAQVLDKRSLVEIAWETTLLAGFQASPYRWVAIGGDGTCMSSAPFCLPEAVPDARLRNALYLRGRRSLGRSWSAGLEYRFYFDDWGVRSHAVQPDLAWRVSPRAVLSVRYRYYTQDEATFYRPRYFDLMSTDGHVTRDRKLSAFLGHEVGASYLHRFEWCEGERVIVGGVRVGASYLDYLAFVGLDHVWAFETTAMLGLELP